MEQSVWFYVLGSAGIATLLTTLVNSLGEWVKLGLASRRSRITSQRDAVSRFLATVRSEQNGYLSVVEGTERENRQRRELGHQEKDDDYYLELEQMKLNIRHSWELMDITLIDPHLRAASEKVGAAVLDPRNDLRPGIHRAPKADEVSFSEFEAALLDLRKATATLGTRTPIRDRAARLSRRRPGSVPVEDE